MSASAQPAAGARSRSHAARVGRVLLWYVLPALAVLVVIAYIVAAIVLDVNPPVVPVEGVSMRPTLHAGDLVFLKGVDPRTLRKGEVIAFSVPKASQQQYHLPGSLVHRIVRITHTDAGLTFLTKGDANSGPDVFKLHSGDIRGRVVGHVAGLGYPILFFRSTQGEIFLGVAALVALIYFLLGVFEERQEYVAGTARGLHTILAETEELKRMLARSAVAAPHRRASPHPEQPTRTDQPTTETMRELLSAIAEYGEHLRSHTAVMQGLATTTQHLEHATGELVNAVNRSPAEGRAATPTGILGELRSPSLRRSFRGYSVDEVSRLLARAAAALEDAASERKRLEGLVGSAEQQLAPERDPAPPAAPPGGAARRLLARARRSLR